MTIPNVSAELESQDAFSGEKVFNAIYSYAPIAIASIGVDGKVIHSNPAFQKFLGYTEEELLGKYYFDVTDLEDRRSSAEAFNLVIGSNFGSFTSEKRYIRKNGTTVWGQVSMVPIRDLEGKFAHAIVMVNDISALKVSLEDQTALLSLLEGTLDATDEGLLVVNLDGKTVISNRRFADLWKIPAELMEAKDDERMLRFVLEQLIHPDWFIARVEEVYANRETPTSDVIEFKDGRLFARSSRPQRIHGKTAGVVWSFRDVTAQSLAERASIDSLEKEQKARTDAEAERRRAEVLSEISRTLAESLDYETTLRAISKLIVPSFADWSAIGLTENETGVRLLTFAADGADRKVTEAIIHTILDVDAPHGIPCVVRTGKSEFYPVVKEEDLYYSGDRWPVVGTRDPSTLERIRQIGLHSFMVVPLPVRGKVIGAMSIASTHPERRYSEADLRFAEEIGRRCAVALDAAIIYRDALKTIQVREDFLSVASHEFRTPLSPLRMQLEMANLFTKGMPDSLPQKSGLIELLSGADLQMDRLLKLVDNLLDVSRITAGRLKLRLEWFDLVGLVQEVVKRFEPMFTKAGCEIHIDLPGACSGYWDRSRIDQVISNLFSNALKFGVGKPISIVLTKLPSEVRLSVKDGGVGIAEEDIGRIFERFERAAAPAQYHGFGLGLYICREIVAAHTGRITVTSKLGQGAKFTLKLPVKTRAEA